MERTSFMYISDISLDFNVKLGRPFGVLNFVNIVLILILNFRNSSKKMLPDALSLESRWYRRAPWQFSLKRPWKEPSRAGI
jgi:hypothetical protein